MDPSELNAETLSMFEAKPFASQTAIYYDDSPEFVEAGRGIDNRSDRAATRRLGRIQRKGPARSGRKRRRGRRFRVGR